MNKTQGEANLCVSFEADTPDDLETPENPHGRESSGRYLFSALVLVSSVPGTKPKSRWKTTNGRRISNFERSIWRLGSLCRGLDRAVQWTPRSCFRIDNA